MNEIEAEIQELHDIIKNYSYKKVKMFVDNFEENFNDKNKIKIKKELCNNISQELQLTKDYMKNIYYYYSYIRIRNVFENSKKQKDPKMFFCSAIKNNWKVKQIFSENNGNINKNKYADIIEEYEFVRNTVNEMEEKKVYNQYIELGKKRALNCKDIYKRKNKDFIEFLACKIYKGE